MSALFAGVRSFLARYPLDPREKSPRHQAILLAISAAMLLAAAICLGLMSLAFGTLYITPVRFFSYFAHPMLLVLNLAPVAALCMLLWLLTDRPWLAFAISWVIVLGLTMIHFFKVVLRDDPLVFEDIAYAGEAAGIVGNYQISFPKVFVAGIVICVLGTIFLALFARGRLGHTRTRLLVRLGCVAAVIALSVWGYQSLYRSDARYNSFENYSTFNRWRPAEDYASRGFVYPLLHSISDVFPAPPEGYSSQNAQALLAQAGSDPIPEQERVNIICVMLESFTDLTDSAELAFAQDPYALLHELESQSLSGTMISDTIGGGTCNSERSFLTGSLYPQPEYRHDTWSYVQYFAEQGYVTEGMHPGYDWYYNRQVVNLNLGFSHYDFNENYFNARTEDEHASDAVFFEALLERYRARDKQKPYFNFSITYQGHGPYSGTELTYGTEYLPRSQLSEENYYIVNNYLGSAADTQEHMAAFLDALREDEEPVVVLFFGDHKPMLGTSNSAYVELGIDLGRETTEGFCNYYATQYLIWGNEAAENVLQTSFSGQAPTVGPYFLMNVLFDACGWEGPAFLKYAEALRERAEVVHSTRVYLSDGVLCQSLEDAGELQQFQMVQYELRKKAYKK